MIWVVNAGVRNHIPTGGADSANSGDTDLPIPQPFRKFGDSFARRAVDGEAMQIAYAVYCDARSCFQEF